MNDLVLPENLLWIGSDHPFDLKEVYIRFRKRFIIDRLPSQSRVFITADSRYVLWINSKFVARGPARSYPHNQLVDDIDVTKFMEQGENVICVMVYQPGYSHFSYVHRATTGLLSYLVFADRFIVTDQTWTVSRDHSYSESVNRLSIYNSGIEKRDMRLAEEWTSLRYDDSSWEHARIVAKPFDYPWTNLSLRPLPQLIETQIALNCLSARQFRIDELDDALLDKESWENSVPFNDYECINHWFHISLKDDDGTCWLFDLGRDYSFQGMMEIQNAIGGESVFLHYIEKLEEGYPYIPDPHTYCRVRMYDQYLLRKGNQEIRPFGIRGGRYLLMEIKGSHSEDFCFKVSANISEYPIVEKQQPSIKDALLNEIYSKCKNTFFACIQDGFVDNPWRESAQCVGDALPQSLMMSVLTEDIRPLKRVIDLAVEGLYPDKVLPSVLPSEAHAYTIVDYNFMWIQLVDLYYSLTRDKDYVIDKLGTMQEVLESFRQDINENGLLVSKPGRRLFLDWSSVSRKEPNAIYNLHYLYGLQIATKLFNQCNLPFSEKLDEQSNRLKSAVRENCFINGIWYDDLERTTFSQQAVALALLTDSCREDEIKSLIKKMVKRSWDLENRDETNQMVLASPFMHYYIFEALKKYDDFESIIEIIKKRWGLWLDEASPTTWENWNVDFPDGSQCHAFSAHPLYYIHQYYTMTCSD